MIVAFISLLVQLFSLLVLARVLLSWVQVDPYHPAVQFIYQVTEPFLKPVRDVLPPAAGFDFSPIVVLILAQILASILMGAVS